MTASGAYRGMTFGSCNMLNSSVASRPAYRRIAFSPPGWSGRNEVTSNTLPSMMTQQSSFLLCFATSAPVQAPPELPAAEGSAFFSDAAGAAAGYRMSRERSMRVKEEGDVSMTAYLGT